jgi:hypothetical protein
MMSRYGILLGYFGMYGSFEKYCRPATPAKGEPMPQTQEYWLKRAMMDQELILEQRDEIEKLKQKVNQLGQKR